MTETLHGGQGSPRCLGVVSGYLLKLIRESVGQTQAALGEELQVDIATIQGWESGRRPLTALRAIDLVRLRMKLVKLGASPSIAQLMNDAIEADIVIAMAVEAGEKAISPDEHPLATLVHRRDLTNLITWGFSGGLPARLDDLPRGRLARRGPVADRPVLHREEQVRFFDHMLTAARALDAPVLRRQAVYLLGFDDRPDTSGWLVNEHTRASDGDPQSLESWIDVRSTAVALARAGELDHLHEFVRSGLADQRRQVANLNYFAYWVGDIEEEQRNDSFMEKTDPNSWGGMKLLRHLLRRLGPQTEHAVLNIHTLWTLVLARPALLEGHPHLQATAERSIEQAAENHTLTSQARQELASVQYAIRLAGR